MKLKECNFYGIPLHYQSKNPVHRLERYALQYSQRSGTRCQRTADNVVSPSKGYRHDCNGFDNFSCAVRN